MKPVHIFLFLLGVILVILAVSFSIPEEGIAVSSFHIENPVKVFYNRTLSGNIRELTGHQPDVGTNMDLGIRQSNLTQTHLYYRDSLLSNIPSIEFPPQVKNEWDSLLLYFETLQTLGETAHILHYGDSQIEGDRFTSGLRDSLQTWYGGGGPGLFLPVMTVPLTASLRITAGKGWTTEFMDLRREKPPVFRKAGVFTGHSVCVPDKNQEAWTFSATEQHFASNKSREINRIRIFWQKRAGTCSLEVITDHGRFDLPVPDAPGIQSSVINLSESSSEYSFSVQTDSAVAIEGISLEKFPGITVDNIPLRGRIMAPLSKTDTMIMNRMMSGLNVRMVIFQFGLNAVAGGGPGILLYQKKFREQVAYLRALDPKIIILVMGITDMFPSGSSSDTLSARFSDIQRRLAVEEDCLFWDSYKAMGGQGAARRWYSEKPGLMRPDLVHLSIEGSRLLTAMFAEAWNRERQRARTKYYNSEE